MKIYVVNELCEVDCTYNNCHKAFTDKDEATDFAKKIYENAINDLGGKDKCDYSKDGDDTCDLYVYNNDYTIEINIDEIELIGILEL